MVIQTKRATALACGLVFVDSDNNSQIRIVSLYYKKKLWRIQKQPEQADWDAIQILNILGLSFLTARRPNPAPLSPASAAATLSPEKMSAGAKTIPFIQSLTVWLSSAPKKSNGLTAAAGLPK